MMDWNKISQNAGREIEPGSGLVQWHLEFLEKMVAIDSRSFSVNEFAGDRATPSDMKEILECARDYLAQIGFSNIRINQPRPEFSGATPILMAEIAVSKDKPTVLFYAHLDKQPYMDDGRFEKWGGIPPTRLHWNKDHTRAYGRGAADDLSGVIAIGMSVHALLKSMGYDPEHPSEKLLQELPCNFKVIYETEEECGSHSLMEQIRQNHDFFAPADLVIITDVVNPATGVPGLTTSLRGIIQLKATLTAKNAADRLDAQTALYKLLATLIRADHSLAVEAIVRSDRPVTDAEWTGYANVPVTVEMIRDAAGLLPETRSIVPETSAALLVWQLRKSFVNARPGHRVSGSIIFGAAGARLTFETCKDAPGLKTALEQLLGQCNPFQLQLTLKKLPAECGQAVFDLLLQSAAKDPHSGMNGGPFPIPELQLARMIDHLIGNDGSLHPSIAAFVKEDRGALQVQSLRVEHDGNSQPFANPSAKAIIEIRLGPGNREDEAARHLMNHLREKVLPGFELTLDTDKGASPWLTGITHPVFPIALESLEQGYGKKSCLYGCGGSIPFVAKLLEALGEVQPICLGAYDPESRMHEPGESLSMADLLGCARSIVHLVPRAAQVFGSQNKPGGPPHD